MEYGKAVNLSRERNSSRCVGLLVRGYVAVDATWYYQMRKTRSHNRSLASLSNGMIIEETKTGIYQLQSQSDRDSGGNWKTCDCNRLPLHVYPMIPFLLQKPHAEFSFKRARAIWDPSIGCVYKLKLRRSSNQVIVCWPFLVCVSEMPHKCCCPWGFF